MITITNVTAGFAYPYSVLSWGGSFASSSVPTIWRGNQLMNNTNIRFEYNTSSNTITFTNVTTSSLCPSITNLPGTETLVAYIYLAY